MCKILLGSLLWYSKVLLTPSYSRHVAILVNTFDSTFADLYAHREALGLAKFYVVQKDSESLASGCGN